MKLIYVCIAIVCSHGTAVYALKNSRQAWRCVRLQTTRPTWRLKRIVATQQSKIEHNRAVDTLRVLRKQYDEVEKSFRVTPTRALQEDMSFIMDAIVTTVNGMGQKGYNDKK